MSRGLGLTLRQAREIRAMSAVDTAKAAGISPAYLSKLENDTVKKPSPQVLHSLSQALAVRYTDLMRLSGYQVPGEPDQAADATAVTARLFGDLTEDETEELLEYLAWYRARRRSRKNAGRSLAMPASTDRAAEPVTERATGEPDS
jgi:transcriptional regulator with XRE-family HTH domain